MTGRSTFAAEGATTAFDVPEGAIPAMNGIRLSTPNAIPAAPGGMDYNPSSCVDQTKAGHACTAPRAKETLYCVGHLRKRGEL